MIDATNSKRRIAAAKVICSILTEQYEEDEKNGERYTRLGKIWINKWLKN